MTLDGLENVLKTAFPRMKVYFIRYADDFLVITPTKEIAERARSSIQSYLTERGLTLSKEKTVITPHDSVEVDNQQELDRVRRILTEKK